MEEDLPQPESEKPRYLLPDGCKDLIDVLRLRQRLVERMRRPVPRGPALTPQSLTDSQKLSSHTPMTKIAHLAEAVPPTPDAFPRLPHSVILRDPITVGNLAQTLQLKPFELVAYLMHVNIFASMDYRLTFETASALCAYYGVVATKGA
jgi:hypothetical protein